MSETKAQCKARERDEDLWADAEMAGRTFDEAPPWFTYHGNEFHDANRLREILNPPTSDDRRAGGDDG